jgi:RNase P/RNase MRP subunit p29
VGEQSGAGYQSVAYAFDATTGVLKSTFVDPVISSGSYRYSEVSISGDTIAVGTQNNAYLFNANSGMTLLSLVDPAPSSDSRFGPVVAFSGNTVVVSGAKQRADGVLDRSVFVFDANTGAFIVEISSPSNESDRFGLFLAIDGNSILVGGRRFSDESHVTESGSVYEFDAATGGLVSTIFDPSPGRGQAFGRSAVISGNTIVVGADDDIEVAPTKSKSVFVFNTSDRSLRTTLQSPIPLADDQFGDALAISGDRIVVGAPGDDTEALDSGRVYVFDANSGELKMTITNPLRDALGNFGANFAISDNIIAVGAPDDTGGIDSGCVYLFDAITGNLLRRIENPSPDAEDYFGLSLAISGSKILVGASGDDFGALNSGIAYLFDIGSGTLLTTLVNPAPEPDDRFSGTLGISGNTVVVGSSFDGNIYSARGNAHIFDATSGALTKTLTSPNPTDEEFGNGVAISQNTIVVTSFGNSSTISKGRIYVYEADSGNLSGVLENPDPANRHLFGNALSISGNSVVVGSNSWDRSVSDQGGAFYFSLDSKQTLTTALGRSFDLDTSTGGSGQFLQGTNNAFDGLNRLQVNGVDFSPLASQLVTLDDANRTVVTPAVTISGLSVSREITVPDTGTEDFVRTIDKFANPTGASITVPVRIVGNLGSDAATVVFATSDGDTIVEPSDSWFATDDADASGSPAIVHVFREPGSIEPTRVDVVGDNVVME